MPSIGVSTKSPYTMPRLESTLAARYLFSRGKGALLSVVSLVAVLGVAIGVATLVLTLAVMDGAETELFGKILQVYPHAKIVSSVPGEPLPDVAAALAAARARPETLWAEPAIDKEALLTSGARDGGELVAGRVVGLTGGERRKLERVFGVGPSSTPGDAPDRPTLAEPGLGEVLLGKPLAERLGVVVGDRVVAITGLLGGSVNRRNPSVALRVAGIFESGYYAFDAATALVSSETAEASFGAAGPDYAEIKLREPFKGAGLFGRFAAEDFGDALRIELGPAYNVETWVDEKGAFHESIRLQKLGLFLILMLIVLVAGFNIVCTLIILVVRKTREIGILKAIGGTEGSVRGVFVRVGAAIGALGTGLGVALGLFGCFLLKHVVRFDMPAKVYDFDRLPVRVDPVTVATIVAAAMAVCVLSALFPARQAARANPVESLRSE